MTFTITLTQVISALIGGFVGYKLKGQIQAWIASIKLAISNALKPKP